MDSRKIETQLTAWQTLQIARHKDRPHAGDYLSRMCDSFLELHGDRAFRDDRAILGGPALFMGMTVMFICHQKGRSTRERQEHNFGMPHPEGYRKAARLMKQAEKFGFPLVCLIDTPGAFPGLEDEERGQSEAIATNLALMSRLRVPVVAVVIGEGGSGGALALSVADRLLMLEYSIYTVAAPEAAASILWRDTVFAPQAAEAMRISARELIDTGIIDAIIPEPPGGAHHNHITAASYLQEVLYQHITDLKRIPLAELLAKRYQKYRTFGSFTHASLSAVL
ncbi:MAG TPA: acetyl-CoA carboxylase carboxyltransferase subunit alpha [Ktedonobacteraceae bacterium]|nr:acetyl-CoA carboxylase carboxyltransferase subunit alpha [Ktedonobacteraceae bacterium]